MASTWAASLADMVGLRQRPTAPPRSAIRTDPPIAQPADPFETRLRTLVQRSTGTSPVIGGTLELVGLDDVRSAMAGSWSLIKDRVRQIAEAELSGQLGASDFYRMHSPSTFLICFSELDKENAERKVRSISERIRRTIIAEFPNVPDAITPEHFVAVIDREALRDDSKLIDSLYATLQNIRKDAEKLVAGRLPSIAERTKLLFAPSWSPTRNIVAFNRCVLDGSTRSRASERLQTELHGSSNDSPLSELDYLVLSRAARTMHAVVAEGRLTPLLVPVRYYTLSNDSKFRAYRKLIQAIHEAYRRLIALQVVDIPAGQSASSVLEVARKVAPSVKWLSLSFAPDDPRIPDCAQAPVWALAVDLQDSRSTDGLLYPRLRRLQSVAAAASLNTFALGVNSIGLALASMNAGITYVDGSAIHPITREPRALGPYRPMLSAISSSRNVKRWQG